jgi:hypothetical protein
MHLASPESTQRLGDPLFVASSFDNLTTNLPITFGNLYDLIKQNLIQAPPVSLGEWQSQQTDRKMRELLHVTFEWQMPDTPEELGRETGARLPWAEDHFQERVGGEPLNPSPSEKWWPFREKRDGDTNTSHKSEGEAFSHTYPERMWPKRANDGHTHPIVHKGEFLGHETNDHHGIRFDYGDLNDVVNQLAKSPNTRQAYLPIWFPEDTGAVHGKRVPCTLGYHFIIRDGVLDISYFMRSTDLVRHFQDDVYLAVRLAQWVRDQLHEDVPHRPIRVGKLIFHTANMHIFDDDVPILEWWATQGKRWY